jgi:hypothetical protein
MNAISEILKPESWELTPDKDKLFSSDHVVDAYMKGREEGLEQSQKLIVDKLISNINKAGKHARNAVTFLSKNKIEYKDAYLKVESWDDLTIMIVLPEREFLSDKMLKVYNYVSSLEDKVSEDLYHLQFDICDTSGQIDEDCLNSDGFVFKLKGL